MLKELVDNNEANFADSGGFVSPSGLSYIGVLQVRLAFLAKQLMRAPLGGKCQGAEEAARLPAFVSSCLHVVASLCSHFAFARHAMCISQACLPV